MTTIDLSTNKKFGNKKIDLTGVTETQTLSFINDLSGQIVYTKDGSKINVKVYAQKQYSFSKTIILHSSEQITTGKYKGKYQKIVTVQKGTIVNDELNWETTKTTTTYVKQKGSGTEDITYRVKQNNNTVYTGNDSPVVADYMPTLNTAKTLGTYTIINGDKAAEPNVDVSLTSKDYNDKKLLSEYWELTPNNKGKVTGSYLNETTSSTEKNEVFDMKGGNDSIEFDEEKNMGSDKVKIINSSNINLKFKNRFNLEYTRDKYDIIFSSGDNVSVRLQDYFKYSQATVNINDVLLKDTLSTKENITNIGDRNSNKSQKIIGTFLKETISGGRKADTIYTGMGDDTVTAYEGNDKIYIDGNGKKTLNFSKGDGDDTVIDAYKATMTDIIFDNKSKIAKLNYIKEGNNLIIKRTYDDNVSEKVTIKSFFDKKPQIYVDGTTDIMSQIEKGNIKLYFEKSKKIIGTDYADIIEAGPKTKTIDAGAGNNEIIFSSTGQSVSVISGKNNDTYTVNNMKSKHIITDLGGQDTLNLGDENDKYTKNNFKFFFDVMAAGKTSDKHDLSTLHIICDENYSNDFSTGIAKLHKIKDTVSIENYFQVNNTEATAGIGVIESIIIDDTTFDFASINAVRAAVSSWLTSGGRNYNSAMDVIKSGTKDDIATLIQMYQCK